MEFISEHIERFQSCFVSDPDLDLRWSTSPEWGLSYDPAHLVHVSGLGYRGFSVTLLGPAISDSDTTLHVSCHMELETLLLETACNVADHVIEHARGVIQQQLQVNNE